MVVPSGRWLGMKSALATTGVISRAAAGRREEMIKMSEHEDDRALETITAADVMTPAPRTCSVFSTVLEAVMIFRDTDCGAVPILSDGKPVAILTDRDVALAMADFRNVVTRPVSDIMVSGTVAVAPGDSLAEVCQVLRQETVRRVLVVDSASVVRGIIGWADIAPVLSDRMMGRVVKDVVTSS
jgi:predicted transcriptional regulator